MAVIVDVVVLVAMVVYVGRIVVVSFVRNFSRFVFHQAEGHWVG